MQEILLVVDAHRSDWKFSQYTHVQPHLFCNLKNVKLGTGRHITKKLFPGLEEQ